MVRLGTDANKECGKSDEEIGEFLTVGEGLNLTGHVSAVNH
jgi:hypothetical protein